MAILGTITAGANLLSGLGSLLGGRSSSRQLKQAMTAAEQAYKDAYAATQARYQEASSLWDTALTMLGREYYEPGMTPLSQRAAATEAQLSQLQQRKANLEKQLAKMQANPIAKLLNKKNIAMLQESLAKTNEQIASLQSMVPQLKKMEEKIYSQPSVAEYPYKQLERAKTRDISKAMQQAIGAGLATTDIATYLPMQWEAQVGAPARESIEQAQRQAWLQAIAGKSGLLASVSSQYPDYVTLSNYAQQIGAQPTLWTQLPGLVQSGAEFYKALFPTPSVGQGSTQTVLL